MAARKHPRKLPLKRWPTPDWDYAHRAYRFLKANFEGFVLASARVQCKGAEHVPTSGPVILAVNHFSWADPVLVSAIVDRPVFYLAKEAVFRSPVTRALMEATGQIKVNRDTGGNEDAVTTAVELLGQRLVVGVFPEGTRARPDQLKRFRTGVARIAALSGAPVVPIALDSAGFWPRGRTAPKVGEKVYINVGPPLRLDLKAGDTTDKQKMREATDDIMDRVAALLAEAQKARASGERWS